MRKGNLEDIDLLFKEGLEDAEIKAPRAVWRNVSSRLDGPAVTRRPVFAWGMAALAFAALATFIYIDNSHDTTIPSSSARDYCEIVVESSGDDFLAYAQESALSSSVKSLHSDSRRPVSKVDVSMTDDAASQSDAVLPVVDRSSGESSAPVDEAWVDVFDDPYTWLAEEASVTQHNASRWSIDAHGLATGNDSHSDYVRPSYSSGYSAAEGVSEESVSAYGVPVSFGLGVRYYLTDALSVDAGLEWSYLTRTFKGSYKTASGDFTHIIQYVGVPVSLSYDLIRARTLKLYVSAGAGAHKAVSSKYYLYSESTSPLYSETVDPLMVSVTGGFGVEFKLTDFLGLYLDPMVSYWIPSGQPRSIRTDKPLSLNFEAGLRFKL